MTQEIKIKVISKDLNPHEANFIELADHIASKIAIKRGNATLPWTGKLLDDAASNIVEARAYLYTIYCLNAEKDEELDRFNNAPLDKWRVLPVYADLVIPATVKYDASSKYDDLLNRSAYDVNGDFFDRSTDNGYKMNVDQFNDFTDWVCATFNFDSSQWQTFDKLRTHQTLANVKDRVSYGDKTDGYGYVPLDLHFRIHKSSRLLIPNLDVTKDYVEAKILEVYKRKGRNNDSSSSN